MMSYECAQFTEQVVLWTATPLTMDNDCVKPLNFFTGLTPLNIFTGFLQSQMSHNALLSWATSLIQRGQLKNTLANG